MGATESVTESVTESLTESVTERVDAGDAAITTRRMYVAGHGGQDEVTEEEILATVHESTPLGEILGGRGAAARNGRSVTGVTERPWIRGTGTGTRYVLTDDVRNVLATYDGTAACLNRLVDQLGVPRNKILDWLDELGRRNAGQPRYGHDSPRSDARRQAKRPEASGEPGTGTGTGTGTAAPAARTPHSQLRQTPAPAQAQTQAAQPIAVDHVDRVELGVWLDSGAEGVWWAKSLLVQPLPETNMFAILFSRPEIPRLPGPVPGHLVEYLIRALTRQVHGQLEGIVYR